MSKYSFFQIFSVKPAVRVWLFFLASCNLIVNNPLRSFVILSIPFVILSASEGSGLRIKSVSRKWTWPDSQKVCKRKNRPTMSLRRSHRRLWQSHFQKAVKILLYLIQNLQLHNTEIGRNYSMSVLGSFSSVTIAPIVERIAKINIRHTQLATIPPL